jgi:mRNA interferase YafQ
VSFFPAAIPAGLLMPPFQTILVRDMLLPVLCVDHAMKGKWKGYRDCHIKPDVVLIYRKRDVDILELGRLGSHVNLKFDGLPENRA